MGRPRNPDPALWQPPLRTTSNRVFACDPPSGWATWGQGGIVSVGQDSDIIKASAAFRREFVRDGSRRYYMATVERPYGGEHIKTAIHNAVGTGWWIRETYGLAYLQWNPMANAWRNHIGIRGDRQRCKEMAIAIAALVCDLQGRPRLLDAAGRPAEHASEAVCMCLATWLNFGLVVMDDMAHRFIKATGIKYGGGSPPTWRHDWETKHLPGAAAKVQGRKVKANDRYHQPLAKPAEEVTHGSPWAGWEDEDEEEQRRARDIGDDDGVRGRAPGDVRPAGGEGGPGGDGPSEG